MSSLREKVGSLHPRRDKFDKEFQSRCLSTNTVTCRIADMSAAFSIQHDDAKIVIK